MTDSYPPIEILIAEDNSLYKKTMIILLNEDPSFKAIEQIAKSILSPDGGILPSYQP